MGMKEVEDYKIVGYGMQTILFVKVIQFKKNFIGCFPRMDRGNH